MTIKIHAHQVKLVSLDGVLTHKVQCPKCGTWGYADDDQFYGRVSLRCGNEGCDFHETQDLSELNQGENTRRK